MKERKMVRDRHGRTWTVSVIRKDEAEAEDFRFWYENLTPEQRVDAVDDALVSVLKTRGIHAAPRLRRVYRIIKRKPR